MDVITTFCDWFFIDNDGLPPLTHISMTQQMRLSNILYALAKHLKLSNLFIYDNKRPKSRIPKFISDLHDTINILDERIHGGLITFMQNIVQPESRDFYLCLSSVFTNNVMDLSYVISGICDAKLIHFNGFIHGKKIYMRNALFVSSARFLKIYNRYDCAIAVRVTTDYDYNVIGVNLILFLNADNARNYQLREIRCKHKWLYSESISFQKILDPYDNKYVRYVGNYCGFELKRNGNYIWNMDGSELNRLNAVGNIIDHTSF